MALFGSPFRCLIIFTLKLFFFCQNPGDLVIKFITFISYLRSLFFVIGKSKYPTHYRSERHET